MSLQTQIRAYMRGIPALPVERQRELAAIAGVDHVYEWGEHGRASNARDAWIRSLIRGDVAWLADLRVLTMPKPPRKSGPMRDLGAAIAAVLATGAVIYDSRAGIRSDDRERWQNHVEWALETARNAERNQKRAKARAKRKPSGKSLVAKWLSDVMTKQRAEAARLWRDPIYATADDACAALPAELQRASTRTLYKILGVRRPNDPGAGGRGKTRTKRKR